jgi:hypothetical protein
MRKLVLLFAVALVLSGQPAGDRYAPLIHALNLTDAQMAKLQAPTPPRPTPTGGPVASYSAGRSAPFRATPALRDSVLDNTQRAILAEIEKQFADLSIRASAITMGLIDEAKWGGSGLCSYSTLIVAAAYGLSDVQVREFIQLEWAAQQPDIRARPRRDLAMVLLNESQIARLTTFESNLELGSEAVELHLLAAPPVNAEILCH